MKLNLGKTERWIRLGLGLTGVAGAILLLEAPTKWWISIGSTVFALTALIGFCPFWAAMGISTKKSCDLN